MAEKVEFELVSPEQLLMSQPVDMVTVPGGEGYFGVLAGHIPVLTTVVPGTIDIWEDDQIIEKVFVEGGFCEVTQTRVTVLVDRALPVSKLVREEVEQQLKNCVEDLEDAKTDEEREAAEANLNLARAKFEAATGQSANV